MSKKIEWMRPLRTGPYHTQHSTKDRRAIILSAAGESPALFHVFIEGDAWGCGSGRNIDGSFCPSNPYHDDWRTLKDVKRAVETHLQGNVQKPLDTD